MGEELHEHAFRVNGTDAPVRARWVFSYSEPNTGNVDAYVSVFLLRGGNRVLVAGALQAKDLARQVRRHVGAHDQLPELTVAGEVPPPGGILSPWPCVERMTRFELATSTLGRSRSTS